MLMLPYSPNIEPNQSFMKIGGENCLHARFCTYKYQGAVDSYLDGLAQISAEIFQPLLESMSYQVVALCQARRVLYDTCYLSDDFSVFTHHCVIIIIIRRREFFGLEVNFNGKLKTNA